MLPEFRPPARWIPTGACSKAELAAARVAAHFAAQVLAAVAVTHLAPAEDDSHTNLTWLPTHGLLAGHPLPNGGLRVALDLRALELVILDGGRVAERHAAVGRSLAELGQAIQEAMGRAGTLDAPAYDMPSHPLGSGAVFSPVPEPALAELAAWYDNASALLEALNPAGRTTLPIRCWPHHFDIATTLYLEDGDTPESAPQMGIGMTPGDAHYDEPYLYVTPWPRDQARELPALEGGGVWRPEGWFGAVLTKTALEKADPEAQAEVAAGFLTSAARGGAAIVRTSA